MRLEPERHERLDEGVRADAFQVKILVSEKRLIKRRGTLAAAELDDIAAAIAICVGVP